MDLYPKNKLPITEVKKFIVIFYIVAVIGFLVPFTKGIFVSITPLALLLNTYLLLIYHNTYKKEVFFAFILVFVFGFIIEVIGVNTGFVFGHYTYGSALGTKVFNTPPLIGLNWLFLTYTSISITRILKIKEAFILFVAPLIMVMYDIVLEQAGHKMDMWYWQDSIVPIKNYLAWYLIGICFVLLFKICRIDTKNPFSVILFTCQLLFLILLTFLLT